VTKDIDERVAAAEGEVIATPAREPVKAAVDEEAPIAVPVHFVGGDDLPILFASNVFIRSEDLTFFVSLAQVHGPYTLNQDREELAQTGVEGRIIARFAIPPNRWKAILDVAVRNYGHWAKAHDGPLLEIQEELQTAEQAVAGPASSSTT